MECYNPIYREEKPVIEHTTPNTALQRAQKTQCEGHKDCRVYRDKNLTKTDHDGESHWGGNEQWAKIKSKYAEKEEKTMTKKTKSTVLYGSASPLDAWLIIY